MNFPSNSNSKTTFKNTFQQPSNQHPQVQQRRYLGQTHQGNSHQALANSTIFHNQEINHQYESFLNKREGIRQKISQAFQIYDKELQATELQRLIFQKPALQEATSLQSFIDNTLFSLYKEEIQDDIGQSKACYQKVQSISRDYQAQLSDWESHINPRQMKEISCSIASLWDKIYKLSLYDPCVIQEICELEWFFRAREVLSHERTDYEYPYVKYCEDLEKGALGSESEKIKGSVFFKRVEEELIQYQRLREIVKGIKEGVHQEDVQGSLQELREFGFGFKEEIESLEKILASQTQTQKKVIEQNHDKNSIVQVKLEDFMDSVLQDISRFDRIEDCSQRSQEEKLRNEVARSILVANKELLGRLAIDMTASQPNGEMCEKQNIADFAEKLIKNLQEHPPKFEDICAWSQTIQEFKLYSKEFEQIKVELCLSKVRFLKVFSETFAKPSKPIPLQDLSKLLVEIKGYHLQGFLESPKKEILKEHMMYLKDLMKKVKAQAHTEVDLQRENEWRPPNIMFYNFIDISNEIDHLKKELENKKRISQISTKVLLNNNHIESLNKKRSSASHPEEHEEINSFNPLVKKIKGEKDYKKVNRSDESSETVPQEGSEKSVNILVEEIVGDVRKRQKNDKKGTEKRNGIEEDDFVIKKKGAKKYQNGSCGDPLQNFEKSDSPKDTQEGLEKRSNPSGDMLVEEIIGDGRKRDKKIVEKRNGQKGEDFVIKKKETKKYLNEGCGANVEQSEDRPVRQYDLEQINDFLIHIDDEFKLKKKNKNEVRVDSKDGIAKIN